MRLNLRRPILFWVALSIQIYVPFATPLTQWYRVGNRALSSLDEGLEPFIIRPIDLLHCWDQDEEQDEKLNILLHDG